MSEKVVGTGPAKGRNGVTAGMLSGVDAVFDQMISGMFGDKSELLADKANMLSGVVGVFDDRVEAVNADIRAKGGDGAVSATAVERRDALATLRDHAAERYFKEIGEKWQRT